MKKIAVHFVPNVIINKTSEKTLSTSYNFGSEFFLRKLPCGHKPNQQDIDLIIENLEKYAVSFKST